MDVSFGRRFTNGFDAGAGITCAEIDRKIRALANSINGQAPIADRATARTAVACSMMLKWRGMEFARLGESRWLTKITS
ncbi:hypothetical protein LVY75_05205 (plasmid) [Sinorhizobium sp. B11]